MQWTKITAKRLKLKPLTGMESVYTADTALPLLNSVLYQRY